MRLLLTVVKDWGPGFAPQGIWLPARVIQLPKHAVYVSNSYADIFRRGQVNNLPPDQNAPWVLNISVDYLGDLPSKSRVHISLLDANGKTFASQELKHVAINNGSISGYTTINGKPDLWWPVGFGKQVLYNLTIDIGPDTQSPVATASKRVGFRTIILNQMDVSEEQISLGTAPGGNWHFEVNGHEIYSKGSNLIPPDPFWPRVTKSHMRSVLGSAIAQNQNMLRVWASSTYMPDFVYDLADEMGILLWSELRES